MESNQMPDNNNNNNEMTTRTRTRHMQIHRHAKLVHVQHLAGKRCKVAPYLALVSLTLAAYTIANLGAGKNLTASSTGLIPVASASPGPEPSAAGGRTHRLPPINGSIFGKRSVQSLGQIHKQQTTTTTTKSRSKATSYQDIITKIIEDFLALNNESDPEEASVAFCRMIVYECSQMLSERHRAHQRRTRTRRPPIDT